MRFVILVRLFGLLGAVEASRVADAGTVDESPIAHPGLFSKFSVPVTIRRHSGNAGSRNTMSSYNAHLASISI